jgi:hypothetical protein
MLWIDLVSTPVAALPPSRRVDPQEPTEPQQDSLNRQPTSTPTMRASWGLLGL